MRSLADEIPFDIPDSWEWVRLGNIGETNIGLTYKPSDVTSDGVPVLRSNNIQNGQIDYSELLYVSCAVPERAYAHKGDILICARNGSRALVGKSAIVDTDGMAFGAFMAIYRSSCNPYIQLFINSYLFRGQLEGATTTTINQVTQEMLKRQLCPLPPIQEQLRIVQKYTELQPLIAAYSNAYDKAQILSTAFPEALKKSILQEAVQGKLVPQDPSDEPAEALLERIRAEKQRLIKDGKIKKDKHESIIFRRDNSHYEKLDGMERCIDDELPFEIPDSWEWVRLGAVLEIARGGSPRPIQQYLTTEPDGINWIKIGDTDKGGKYIYKTKEKIRPEGVTKSRMVHSGDFLLTNSMSFGRPYILKTDGCIHDGWLVLSNRFDCYSVDFLYYILSSPFAYYQFCDSVSGAVVKNLNSDKVANALFPLPPLSEQVHIVQRIEELLPLVKGL